MREDILRLCERLERDHALSEEEYRQMIDAYTPELAAYLGKRADRARWAVYGNHVYIRGLIEISNICKNDCLYCGIRRGNARCDRYRLSAEEILSACEEGYALGFRTFVLQGGEDPVFTDEVVCGIVRRIKESCPGCAVTLSLGERSGESYARLKAAGADRYLLRHETADEAHYALLHPKDMSFSNRMRCLKDLKSLGYQTGCGFMVGSPGQTSAHLAKDLKFIETFRPQMCGIGPFIPHKDTPFAKEKAGAAGLTCYLLSIIRLIHPNILLPATTALATVGDDGRERGIRAGANVVMPNLSPASVRKKYALYDGKKSDGDESAQQAAHLKEKMAAIGYEVVTGAGHYKEA